MIARAEIETAPIGTTTPRMLRNEMNATIDMIRAASGTSTVMSLIITRVISALT